MELDKMKIEECLMTTWSSCLVVLLFEVDPYPFHLLLQILLLLNQCCPIIQSIVTTTKCTQGNSNYVKS